MYRKFIILLSFWMVMFGMLIFVGINQNNELDEIVVKGDISDFYHEVSIKGWYKSEENVYYFFLPAGNSDLLTFSFEEKTQICINDDIVEEGESITQYIDDDNACVIEIYKGNRRKTVQAKFIQSNTPAALFVNTATGSMKQIYSSKDNKEPVNIATYDSEDNCENVGSLATIKGRGNSTWLKTKKQFTISFEETKSLFGLPESSKWVLLSNAYDAFSVRNEIAFEMGRILELETTASSKYVDLYLNGEYNGLYLLVQSPDSLFEQLRMSEEDLIICSADMVSRYADKPKSVIDKEGEHLVEIKNLNKVDNETKRVVTEKLYTLDNIIKSDNEDISRFMDVDSWAKTYLINEILENYDAGLASMFFYWDVKDDNAKVYAGPIWDYDNSIDNIASGINTGANNPRVLYACNMLRSPENRRLWYPELYKNQLFYDEVVFFYSERLNKWLERDFEYYLTNLLNEVSDYNKCNGVRWNKKLDYESECEHILEYISERKSFLDSVWLDGNRYSRISWINASDDTETYNYYYIQYGTSVTEYDDEYVKAIIDNVWYTADGELFDASTRIYEDVDLISTQRDYFAKIIDYKELLLAFSIGTIIIVIAILFVVDAKRNKDGKGIYE